MPGFIDRNDLRVTASSAETVRRLDLFGHQLLAFSADAGSVIALADDDPECPLAQAYAAQIYASCDTTDLRAAARPYLARAQALAGAGAATAREQAVIHAAGLYCDMRRREGARVLEQVLDDAPADIISAKWAQAMHFDTGNAAGLLRAPLKAAAAQDGNAYLHGMLAFGYEECHMLDAAEHAVMRALALRRAEPWAHHAMAHVHEGRNSLDGGLAFMMEVSDTWQGLSSFMVTHNWWHVCLFLIDLDRGDEALALHDRQVWAHDRTSVQDQINAISLLYRLERTGLDVGDRWQTLAAAVLPNARAQVSLFLDMQFLYALARAGHPEADAMAGRIIARADTCAAEERPVWHDIGGALAPAILALARGDHGAAVPLFDRVRGRLAAIGGSHAQRDLVALFHIDALRGAGDWGRAQQALALRHLARPQGGWIARQLAEAHDRLSLPRFDA